MKRFFWFLFVSLAIWGCSTEDPDCGCESEPVYTIQENEAVDGFLYMLVDSQVDYQKDGPMLCIDPANSGDCLYFYDICNPVALDAIEDIPPYPGVAVTFSGVIRNKCEQPAARLLITSYSKITISSIEKTQ